MLNADPRIFTTSLSSSIKLITYLVGWGVGLGLPCALAALLIATQGLWFTLLLPALMLLVLGTAYVYRPLGYRVGDGEFEVLRPLKGRKLALSQIESIRPITKQELGFSVGLCRSGGFYGGYGLFWSRSLGVFWAWLGNTEHMLLLKPRGLAPLLISPDEPERLLAALAEQGVSTQR